MLIYVMNSSPLLDYTCQESRNHTCSARYWTPGLQGWHSIIRYGQCHLSLLTVSWDHLLAHTTEAHGLPDYLPDPRAASGADLPLVRGVSTLALQSNTGAIIRVVFRKWARGTTQARPWPEPLTLKRPNSRGGRPQRKDRVAPFCLLTP